MGTFRRVRHWLWAILLPFFVEVLRHMFAALLLEWSRSAVKQSGWRKAVGAMAFAFATHPLVVSGSLTLLICAFVIIMAAREERAERSAVGMADAAPPVPPPPSKPSPPVIEYIESEANVPLMRTPHRRYSRLPANGELTAGALAALRHRGGPDVTMIAHLHVGDVHAHSVPWVGSSGEKRTLSESETAELILALHTDYGCYYIPDVSYGLTHKSVPYGTYVAELDLDIIGGQTKRYIVDLVLTKSRENMRISRREA